MADARNGGRAMNLADLLLLPDDAHEYATYDDATLLQLATQRMEPFIATSALGALAVRKVAATRDAALTILQAEQWDRHLTAYALTTLFECDRDLGTQEMARLLATTTDPKILDAMVVNVLSDRAHFEPAASRTLTATLADRLTRAEPDPFTDREQCAAFLSIYSPPMSDLARRKELNDHRRYVESQGSEGVKVAWYGEDLAGVELTGAVLCDATLMEANFTGATLDRADLYGAFAGGARFTGASLVGANLGKSVLEGCSFENVHARGARFSKTNLREARFDNADLASAILDGATCDRTSFSRADLTGVSLVTTMFGNADLRGAKLGKARFERTVFDHATRFDDCTGLETAEVITIVAGDQKLEGEAGRAWLLSRAQPLPWSVEDFELYLLSKMKGPRALEAAERLCPDAARRAEIVAGVASVFDAMPHAAVDYERVIGAPHERRPIVDAPQTFGESTRAEFVLPLWPEVVFGVNTDQDGLPWNIGFTGPAGVPDDPRAIEPWKWTAVRLEELATGFEVEEQWNHDLDAIVTFGTDRFRATFVFGLLQSWSPA